MLFDLAADVPARECREAQVQHNRGGISRRNASSADFPSQLISTANFSVSNRRFSALCTARSSSTTKIRSIAMFFGEVELQTLDSKQAYYHSTPM